jgi:hypothetical protein
MYPDEAFSEPVNPDRPLLDPKSSEALMRLLIGALLFRLGGEETFTESALQDIMVTVGGVQILYIVSKDPENPEGRYVLRVRDPRRAAEIVEKGMAL